MMQIKTFETTGIEAKRFSKAGERVANVRIDQNSSIIQITKAQDNTASIDFRFTANYVGLGFIKIEGQMIVSGDVDVLIADWGKEGNMNPDDANAVHNTIVSNCLPTALLVARDIKLPPPFPLPRINVQKKSEMKPGSGVEVA
ncbi:MAG: hypothetical protein A4E32_00164 [Methanomassiliicoccales archaeon PtaU1.Bin124]|nr:MAG: hypothetical protein A4E32_00164 [Methanomassiliicoccales archaeon PtaU1.Bin124]